ncbi:MAG TPA: ADOP family duplicated permease [Longimicrobiales bacterium]|nr:ADOP family duplicated permease [Longimicrobiales bacterium]
MIMRLKQLLTRAPSDSELDEELEFHIAMECKRLERDGVAPAEARRLARVAFGGYDRVVEETRDARGAAWIENAWRDVRFAARGLARNPGFTLVAVLTLAIGIGATTAVFSLANVLLIRPVPGVRAPDELVVVQLSPERGLITGISHANIEDLRAGAPALSGLAGYTPRTMQARASEGAPFEVDAAIVEGDYFEVLGLEPREGRWFTAAERAPGAAGDVVVISERFRSSRLGGAEGVVGDRLHLNAASYTIVGVAPAGFHGTERTSATDVWLPPAAYGRMWHRPVDASDRRASIFTELVGRLAPRATPAHAEQQLRAIMAALVERYPDVNADYVENLPTVYPGIGVPVGVRPETTRTIRLLFGIVAVLLLIACANVANLLLFRGVSRRGETAVRRALGASGTRLAQQHMAEGLLLSLLGGAAGVVVAVALSVAFQGQGLPGLPAIDSIALDWRVITFAFSGAVFTGVLFTLAPALGALRMKLTDAMSATGRSASGDGARLRGALTVLQVAASLALLVGALLLVRTVQNLRGVERGLDPEAVLAYGYDPSPQGHDSESARVLRRRLLEDVAALPGITSATIASFLPVPGDRMLARLSVPGSDDAPVVAASFDVSAEYFTTLGTRIVAGRAFTTAEQYDLPAAGRGVVLGAATARALFGDGEAVGRLVDVHGFTGTTQQPVIGVAEDVRLNARDDVVPAVYQPLGAAGMSLGYVLVRSRLPPAQTERVIADALERIDPGIPLFHAESLGAGFRRAIAEERLLARLLGLFAALAVALAAIGLYGVVAYGVARRRREIGIRMALGAQAATVVRMVARQSFTLVAIGVSLGVLGGYALSRVLASRIYGVTPVDPPTYAAAMVSFTLLAAVASAIPARTATRVDPIETLRQE